MIASDSDRMPLMPSPIMPFISKTSSLCNLFELLIALPPDVEEGDAGPLDAICNGNGDTVAATNPWQSAAT